MSEAIANHNSSLNFPFYRRGKLDVLKGGAVLGRKTNIRVDSTEFITNPIIRNMSTAHVAKELIYNAEPGKRDKIERPERDKTSIAEIIKTILDVTHRDIGSVALSELFEQIDVDFEEFEEAGMAHDKNITVAINETGNKFESTDLMVGMDAFTDATRDRHGVMYDATILEPTTRFARWLILLESEV